MRTQPVLDQTALRTVRSLIGYGCGKEAKAGQRARRWMLPRPHILCAVRRVMTRKPRSDQSPSVRAFNWIVSAPRKVVAEHSGFIIDAVTSLRPAMRSAVGFD